MLATVHRRPESTRHTGRGFAAVVFSAGAWLGAAKADPIATEHRPALPAYFNNNPYKAQCGPMDESQHVEFYDGKLIVSRDYVSENEPSTALIRWMPGAAMTAELAGMGYRNVELGNVAGQGWCSAKLIGRNRLLTAGHCFQEQTGKYEWYTPVWYRNPNEMFHLLTHNEHARLMQVVFKQQKSFDTGVLGQTYTYPVQSLLVDGLALDSPLDFAIIEVAAGAGGYPGDSFRAVTRVRKDPLPKGSPLALLQHPDSLLDPKCPKCKKVNSGTLAGSDGSYISYADLDTLNTSSGSVLQDADGAIVGVHIFGGCTTSGGANIGVSIGAILKAAPSVLGYFGTP